MSFQPVAFEKADEVVAAYDAGRCDVYTTDRSGLAAQRGKLTQPDAMLFCLKSSQKSLLAQSFVRVMISGSTLFVGH